MGQPKNTTSSPTPGGKGIKETGTANAQGSRPMGIHHAIELKGKT